MNLLRKINWLCTAMMCLLFVASCSDEETVTIGQTGYIQLRLFPQSITRAGGLDYMADAKKIELSLLSGDKPVVQSLNLSAVPGTSEFGLISEKLELHTGGYKLMSYTLYSDVKPGAEQPEKLFVGYPEGDMLFHISQGHLTEVELDVKATLRGNVFFELEKDLSNYQDMVDQAQANSRAIEIPENLFNYDDIAEVDLYYSTKGTSEHPTPHTFKVYRKAGDKYFHTDTANWAVGEYEISRFMLYTEKRRELILAGDLEDISVKVEANRFTKSVAPVKYPKEMLAMKDYMALYNIWINLEGLDWNYAGESYPVGSNWRFKDRPVDQWGIQPGVELDRNGRVKAMDLGSFNPSGEVHSALGDLTELEGLWLGTHGDLHAVDETQYSINTFELYRQGVDLRGNRWKIARESFRLRHPQRSSNIYEMKRAPYEYARKYDFDQGAIANRITKVPEEIGKLKKLGSLFIANGYVSELPNGLAELPELTDMEIYNCRLTEFPAVLNKMQKLVSLNFSCNATISPEKMTEGLNQFFLSGGSKELQILYLTSCNLKVFPVEMKNAKKIGLIDMANNKLIELPDLERRIAPVQALFDNNRITRVSDTFCDTDDVETFSISNNLLTEFPNLFGNGKGSASKYVCESVDFSYNHITHFKEGFLGANSKTLVLTGNRFGEREGGKVKGKRTFPDDLSRTKSKMEHLQIGNCEIDSLPPSAFKNLKTLIALDASGNYLKYIPYQFNVETLPYLSGLNLSMNSFSHFPVEVLNVQNLNKLYLTDQMEVVKNAGGQIVKELRCLQKWPEKVQTHFALRLIDVSGNDIRKITELDFPVQLALFNVADNPNLEMTVPSATCSAIANGRFSLGFDSNQYILGCPILDVDNNK